MMRVLHICNDFLGSRVHANLYQSLDRCGVEQSVFVPMKESSSDSMRQPMWNFPIVKAKVVKSYHRFLYHIKRRVVFNALLDRVNLSDYDLIHATNLFTDGGVAYLAYRESHVPYIVAVRDTDVSLFLRFMPHTWLSGWRVLLNAKRIVFISKTLKDTFMRSWVVRPILNRIKDKIILQPNGVDEYWCDHVRHETVNNHRILYVGVFSRRKNVRRLMNAVVSLRKEPRFSDVTLTLVGAERTLSDSLKRRISACGDIVQYRGEVTDKTKLCEIYREHSIFAMPSLHETFGLTYVEALSQNLAILYTKGQGVDGLFDERVGIGVNPTSVDSIRTALSEMLEHREKYSNKGVDFGMFQWSPIAERYLSIYFQVLKEQEGRL